MQTFGILVTSLSKKWPLVEAVKKAAGRLTDHSVIHGADSHENCIAKWAVDCFWNWPLLSDLTVDQVLEYCRQNQIKAIIPTRNEDVEFFTLHKLAFNKEGIGVMVSSPPTVKCCLDKLQFSHDLIQSSLPAIPSYLSMDESDAPAYVVKERWGAGGKNVGINLTKNEANQFAKSLQAPLFQPFIKGDEWSLDIYRSLKGKVMGVVARQRNLVVKGESQVTTTQSYSALETLGADVSNVLNLYGHAVLQVIEDEYKKFHIIECNPRFGGASTASLAVGLDSFYWFLLECMQQEIDNYPFMRSSTEIRQVRHPADWIFPWS